MWCNMAWHGMVWCGVVWCGMAWHDGVWHGMVWCGVVEVGSALGCARRAIGLRGRGMGRGVGGSAHPVFVVKLHELRLYLLTVHICGPVPGGTVEGGDIMTPFDRPISQVGDCLGRITTELPPGEDASEAYGIEWDGM